MWSNQTRRQSNSYKQGLSATLYILQDQVLGEITLIIVI